MDWAFALEVPLKVPLEASLEVPLEPSPTISDITLDAGLLEETTLTDIDDFTLIQSEVRIVYEDNTELY